MICDETSSSGAPRLVWDLAVGRRVGRVGVASRLRAMARLARSRAIVKTCG